MIQILKNPKPESYIKAKEVALSDTLPVHWQSSYTGVFCYSHHLIARPELLYYSHPVSTHADLFVAAIGQTLSANNLAGNGFHIIRAAINVVHPSEGNQFSEPHVDHPFPHVNLLMYFTDVGGRTFCEKEEHDPQEDDIILFKGEHYMERPKKDRRVILVSTLQIY